MVFIDTRNLVGLLVVCAAKAKLESKGGFVFNLRLLNTKTKKKQLIGGFLKSADDLHGVLDKRKGRSNMPSSEGVKNKEQSGKLVLFYYREKSNVASLRHTCMYCIICFPV